MMLATLLCPAVAKSGEPLGGRSTSPNIVFGSGINGRRAAPTSRDDNDGGRVCELDRFYI